ncbi:hypothetical protein BDR06DRAFT_964421 [Suillus hirtellus]|nr:hypothetical protein BDR06DRAFT_964421 [Suillus hirtellus]
MSPGTGASHFGLWGIFFWPSMSPGTGAFIFLSLLLKSNLLTCSLALSDPLNFPACFFVLFSSLICANSVFSSFISHIVW